MAENKHWITMCTHCNMYMSKKQMNFGLDAKKAKCPYCERKFKMVKKNLVDARAAAEIVRTLNIKGKEMTGFATFEKKV